MSARESSRIASPILETHVRAGADTDSSIVRLKNGACDSEAAAAVLGLIPIAGEVFWGPMAYAMMGGVLVATVLTLFFLPALYAVWYRVPDDPNRTG
jgi:Cu/Ag efflux pump CusA